MKRRIGSLLRIVGIAAIMFGTISLVRWRPAWLIWTIVGIWIINGLLILALAVGWTIEKRMLAKKQAGDMPETDERGDCPICGHTIKECTCALPEELFRKDNESKNK